MKKIHDCKVITNKILNDEYYILRVLAPEKLEPIKPGQFVEVLVTGSNTTFLRRPLSIHDVDYNENSFSLLVRIAGEGTRKLSGLGAGDIINIMYPLGNGFTVKNEQKVLLAGGGCGIAPMLHLAKVLKENNCEVSLLLGARSENDLFELDEFAKYGKVFCITNDGSLGEKGLITDHSLFKSVNNFDIIYTCGPEIMMKAIARIAKQNNVECEVSLENTMACGIGACLCCVTDTVKGNLCVCTEGPVFNIKDLKWQI